MKKNIIILQILAVTLLTTSCGSTNPPNFHKVKKVPVGSKITKETTTEVVFDQLYYDYEKNVEFTLFRSGDSYILCRDNNSNNLVDKNDEVSGVNSNWTRVESEIPEEIKIKDFEFLHVKADLTLLNGGEAGFANAPVITKVYEQKAMTYDEAIEKHLIKNYDRSVEYFAGPKICESNGDTFIIVYCSYQNYRVYKNGKYMDTFTNAYAADGAMGLAEIDGTADYKKDNMYNLFVFKCGDTYLGYKDNKWTPILNESYKNEIANLTLKDGEMACIMNANILIANGGKRNFENSIILRNYKSVDTCKYDIFTLHTTEQHWEGETPLENECSEYKCGQYLIFNIDNKFYVYKDRETDIDSPTLIGTYETIEDVNDALGIKY